MVSTTELVSPTHLGDGDIRLCIYTGTDEWQLLSGIQPVGLPTFEEDETGTRNSLLGRPLGSIVVIQCVVALESVDKSSNQPRQPQRRFRVWVLGQIEL